MSDRRFEYANFANLTFIEDLYSKYLEDPFAVDISWQRFFEGMAFGSRLQQIGVEYPNTDKSCELRICNLIKAYRINGHKAAQFNPISLQAINLDDISELSLTHLGFAQSDLSKQFPTCGFFKEQQASLSSIIDSLKKIYCGSVGFEYMSIQDSDVIKFIQKEVEPYFFPNLTKEEKIQLLYQLNASEAFESFIHMKYPGQKRFSLEGGETLIPIMHALINEAGEEGVQMMMIGMAHRGRLNVLANILRKSYAMIFHEFESNYIPDSFEGTGDVKYHKGFTANIQTKSGKDINLFLAANPSHLESVDPVVVGQVRAYQEKELKNRVNTVVPILIHGDAAIAGQGVVYETMQLSQVPGYNAGGTIHIVINNQVGFTANPEESRSTLYCTDLAKTFGAPVFHVNAEEPESCVEVSRLAMRLRQRFHCDVFIEMNCYRKYGHNETDEPGFTQPLLYQAIKDRKNIRDLYCDFLLTEESLSKEEAKTCKRKFQQILETELSKTKERAKENRIVTLPAEKKNTSLLKEIVTGVRLSHLKALAQKFCQIPYEFNIHPKVRRIFDDRLSMIEANPTAPVIDWGMAEYLAYATLLSEGIHIRLSGQDSGRGTFSHRHAVLIDQKTQDIYIPLNNIQKDQALIDVYNSPLSEYAVLGFEYGYSLFYEKALVIWEAQFGDFANGAQITIDQYIVSAEQKWGNRSALTLLLPHGYEGMGPEHSSARIERFLQLAANDSIYVVVPSSSAQFYHALRRQGISQCKKPLILFSPKALLRFPPSASFPKDLEEGTSFQEVIDDPMPPSQANKIFFCMGKVFYDLIQAREERDASNIAIIRIEQLYPLHLQKIQAIIEKYKGFSSCYWIQEEHRNMGAWEYIRPHLQKLLPEKLELRYVGRIRSASPAAGSGALHKFELAKFINEAFE